MRFRRVLVTGAAGFVGSAAVPVLRRLLPGARLTLAARTARGPYVAADLSDPGSARDLVARARPDAVLHLAGGGGGPPTDALWRDHVRSTLNLADALRQTSPTCRLVVAGSCAEYGRTPDIGVTEGFPCSPLTAYGAVKLCQTLAALSYVPEGLDVRVARIFNLLGPGSPKTLAPGAFAAQIASLERSGGGTVLHGDLRPTRDFLDVRDAAEALAALLLAEGLSGCFNICSGRATPMSAVLQAFLGAARIPLAARRDPARMRALEVRGIRGSHARLTRLTGWRPRIRFPSAIADTLDWHRRRP